MFIAVSLILFVSFYTSNARTCVCAQFDADSCNAQENCVWNEMDITTGLIVKGDHGLCRSQKWLDCHTADDCFIEGRLEEDVDEDVDVDVDVETRRRLVENMDWPYCCMEEDIAAGDEPLTDELPCDIEHEGTLYFKNIINVRPYDLLVAQSAAKPSMARSSNHHHSLSMSVIATFIGVMTCVILIIVYGIKRTNNRKDLQHLGDKIESYATF